MSHCSIVRSALVFLAAATWLISPGRSSAENPADEHAKLTLISQSDGIVPDKELWLGFRFDLEDGWHTYWLNPGDSGEPPRIEWELPAGFQAGPVQWPYPKRLSTPPFVDYGYEHQVLLIVAVRPATGLKVGTPQRIAADVRYLVCREVCIPARKQLELMLPVKGSAGTGSDLHLFEATREHLPRPAPGSWKISAVAEGDEFLLNLRGVKSAAIPQFFPLEEEQIENAAPQDATTIPGGFRLHLKKSKHLLKPITQLKGVIVAGSGEAYIVDAPVSQPSNQVHTQSIKN